MGHNGQVDPVNESSAPEWNNDITAIEQIFGNRARTDMIRVPASEEQMSYGTPVTEPCTVTYARWKNAVVIADLSSGQRQGRGVRYPSHRSRSGRRVACLP